jgi:hypothetical protein
MKLTEENKQKIVDFSTGKTATFTGYYKYSFDYKLDEKYEGKTVLFSFGGTSDEIYRSEFLPKEKIYLDSTENYFFEETDTYIKISEM